MMARKRMFDMEIIDTDLFLEMSASTQNLYFHLGMRADDDGFVSNPKKIQKIIGSNEDDLKVLIAKKFVIPFETGVIVIRHWKLNNYLRKDRYIPTIYTNEKAMLTEDENGVYDIGIPLVDQLSPNGLHSIEKNSIEKNSIEKNKPDKISFAEFVSMTNEEYAKLIETYGEENVKKFIEKLDNYKGATGKKYKSDYRAILSWVVTEVKRQSTDNSKPKSSGDKLKEMIQGGIFDD